MNNISKIKLLSLWVFLVPFITVNACLIIVSVFNEYIPKGVGIAPTFPYIDGATSISRTARNFPTNLIFKPGMIATSILLIYYWYLNKILLTNFVGKNKTINLFFFFGVLSAIFLTLHSIFLGINFDNTFYKIFRKIILLGFIIFEIFAQSFLVLNLYKSYKIISDYINKSILNLKFCLLSLLIIVTILSIPIISRPGNPNFKHALEWNYFLGVIFFYFLTFLMWRKKK